MKLKGHIKGRFISRILNFLKNLSCGLKIIRKFVEVERNFYKTFNKSLSIHTNQILLSCNRLELSPWSSTHVFKKIETTMRWNCMSKALRFSQITAKKQYCPVFTVFLAIKTSSQNISITLLQISLKLHEHRGRCWRKKLPWTILEEQFPVPRNTAGSKIGNGGMSLLWQLRCHCNLDHDKLSSLSNTTVVAIFLNLCLCLTSQVWA